jgi:DNA-binding transcriptional LysR family regulator
MRINRPDLNAVQIFVRVIESGGFTAAGLALGVPKSTVSDRVSELEECLGVSLLLRTTRKLRLTDAGAEYFRQAKHAVDQLRIANEHASQSQKQPAGVLRISAPADLALPEFMAAVTRYRAKFSEVTVECNFNNRQIDLVSEGYDIVIRGGVLADSAMIAKKIGESYMIVVTSARYMREAPPISHPQELILHKVIIMNESNFSQNIWDLQTASGDVLPVRVSNNPISTNSFVAMRSLVAMGGGVALIPRAFCKADVAQGHLIQILPEWTTAKIALYAVYAAQRYSSPKIKEFIAILEEEMGSLFK